MYDLADLAPARPYTFTLLYEHMTVIAGVRPRRSCAVDQITLSPRRWSQLFDVVLRRDRRHAPQLLRHGDVRRREG